MDEEKNARIIVGASEVAGDRRHLYLPFERSDGSRIVVRGGPDARSEGNDLANLAESADKLAAAQGFSSAIVVTPNAFTLHKGSMYSNSPTTGGVSRCSGPGATRRG